MGDDNKFKVIDEGHQYELDNIDGGTQTLQFIRKEPEDDGVTLKTMINGTTNEAVLGVIINRLAYLNEVLPDSFTKEAIDHCEAALHALEARTEDRQGRGVEGTNKE